MPQLVAVWFVILLPVFMYFHEITRDRTVQLFISKFDLDYAYGQIRLSDKTSRQCVFALTGGNFRGCYRFEKGF